MLINPIAYNLGSSICGGLAVLPLDIIQTNMMSSKNVEFHMEEFKWLLLMPMVFLLQNTAYTRTARLNNQAIRGVIAGIVSSPFYIFLQAKKFNSRFKLMPNMRPFILWMTLRQMILYASLYSIYMMNIPYAKFVAGLIANGGVYPIRYMCMSKSYSMIKTDANTVKKIAILEIIKSGLGDGIALYLIYSIKH